MANRLEYKYLVPVECLDDIRSDIRPFVEVDKHAIDRQPQEYTIRSIYFDTPCMSCYYEKIDGVKVRKKYRIRGYNELNDSDIIFLEIKRKNNNYISKNRAPLYNYNLERLFATRDLDEYIVSFEDNEKHLEDAQKFFYHYYRKKLSPVILIIYEREAFEGIFNKSLRITFDKNLRSRLFQQDDDLRQEQQLKYAMQKYFILEVKFGGSLPAWMLQIVKNYSLPRLALSKYTICLDSYKVNKATARMITANQCAARFP